MAIGVVSSSFASPIMAHPENDTTRIAGISADFEILGKSFYLDVKLTSKVAKLSRTIIFHGGTVESFLSKDVNFLITDEKRTDSGGQKQEVKKKTPLVTSRARAMLQKSVSTETSTFPFGVMNVATNLGIPVIRYDDFYKLLSCQTKSKTQSQLNSRNDVRSLKPSFIKFEDMSSNFRPELKEFTSFPRVKFNHNLNNNILCPFFEDIVRGDDVQIKPAQITPVPMSHRSAKPLTDLTNVPSPLMHKSKKKGDVKQRGYCECCDVFYTSSLDQHLEGPTHQKFANDISNYACVDNLLNALPSVDDWISNLKQKESKIFHSETKHETIHTKAMRADPKMINGTNKNTSRKVNSNTQCTPSQEQRNDFRTAGVVDRPVRVVDVIPREREHDSERTLRASAVCGVRNRLIDGNRNQYIIHGEKVAGNNNKHKSAIANVRSQTRSKIPIAASADSVTADSTPSSRNSCSALSITAGYITDALAIVDCNPDEMPLSTNPSERNQRPLIADSDDQNLCDRASVDFPSMNVCPQTTFYSNMRFESRNPPQTGVNYDNFIPYCDIGSEAIKTIGARALPGENLDFVRTWAENDCHSPFRPWAASSAFTNQYNCKLYYENTTAPEKAEMRVNESVKDKLTCSGRAKKSNNSATGRTMKSVASAKSMANQKTRECMSAQSVLATTNVREQERIGSQEWKKHSQSQVSNQESPAINIHSERVSVQRSMPDPTTNTKHNKNRTTELNTRLQEISGHTVLETHLLNANSLQTAKPCTTVRPNSPYSSSSDCTIITGQQNSGHEPSSSSSCDDSDLENSSDTIITGADDWQVKMTTGLKIRIVRLTPKVKNNNKSNDCTNVKSLSKSKTGQKRKQALLNISANLPNCVSDKKCKRRKLQF